MHAYILCTQCKTVLHLRYTTTTTTTTTTTATATSTSSATATATATTTTTTTTTTIRSGVTVLSLKCNVGYVIPADNNANIKVMQCDNDMCAVSIT